MPNGRKQQGVAYSTRVPLARDSTAEEPRYFWERLAQAQNCFGPPRKAPPGVLASEMAAQAKQNGELAAKHSPSDWIWFKSQVEDHQPWDYKRYHPDFEDFGNYNYGYAGTKQGIPAPALRAGAAAVQVRDGHSKWRFFRSVFDDPKDREQIDRGISDALNNCY